VTGISVLEVNRLIWCRAAAQARLAPSIHLQRRLASASHILTPSYKVPELGNRRRGGGAGNLANGAVVNCAHAQHWLLVHHKQIRRLLNSSGRVCIQGLSSLSSVFTLCNSAIGAGVLSLPFAFRCAGKMLSLLRASRAPSSCRRCTETQEASPGRCFLATYRCRGLPHHDGGPGLVRRLHAVRPGQVC
jgi:hypothetical protein